MVVWNMKHSLVLPDPWGRFAPTHRTKTHFSGQLRSHQQFGNAWKSRKLVELKCPFSGVFISDWDPMGWKSPCCTRICLGNILVHFFKAAFLIANPSPWWPAGWWPGVWIQSRQANARWDENSEESLGDLYFPFMRKTQPMGNRLKLLGEFHI